MHESVQQPSGIKNEKLFICTPLGTFSAFCRLLYFRVVIILKLLKIRILNFQHFLVVGRSPHVKFQTRYKCFKVDISRISPIAV